MPKLTFLPHEAICPDGATVEADSGVSILNAALASNIPIEHACEKSCACTTCHVIVRQGFDSLEEAEENEEDYLDKAWGLEPGGLLGVYWGSRGSRYGFRSWLRTCLSKKKPYRRPLNVARCLGKSANH